MKPSRADGHAKVWKFSSVSGTDSVPISWLHSLARGAHIPSCTQAKWRSIHKQHSRPCVFSFGSTKPTVAPWNGDGVSPWNGAICPRFYWRKVVLWMPQRIWGGWQYSFTHFWSQKLSEVSSHMYQPQEKRPSTHWVGSLVDPRIRHSGEEQNLLPPSNIAARVLSCPAHYSNSRKRADSGQSKHQARGEISHFQTQLDSYHLT